MNSSKRDHWSLKDSRSFLEVWRFGFGTSARGFVLMAWGAGAVSRATMLLRDLRVKNVLSCTTVAA